MKKVEPINIITVFFVIVACLIGALVAPTEIGVNIKTNGELPTAVQTGNNSPVAAPSEVQTTAPVQTPTAPSDDTNKPDTPADKTQQESGDSKSTKAIIDKYTLLVDKFKKEKPAYKKKEFQALPEEYRNFGSGVNAVLGIAANYMVTEDECEVLERAPGAEEILYDMPIHGTEKGCALTDYNAVEWAKEEELADGTRKISFVLKEEINAEPTPADTLVPPSAHGAVMQPMKFSDIKAEVDKVTSSLSFVTVNQFDLIYRDCEFSCIYDPKTDEVLSITHHIVIDISADAKLFGAGIKGTARLLNEMFIYDITW